MPENVQIKFRGGDPVQSCAGNSVQMLGYPIPAWMKGPNGQVSAFYDKRSGVLGMAGPMARPRSDSSRGPKPAPIPR